MADRISAAEKRVVRAAMARHRFWSSVPPPGETTEQRDAQDEKLRESEYRACRALERLKGAKRGK